MSEAAMEGAAPVEKESGAVRKMAERVGRFLSETYTVKGATAKELRQLDRVVAGFTPSQQAEMRAYFGAKAEKNAKWKVIRNWVATGAGIALGGWVAAVGPDKALAAVVLAGKSVAEWWGIHISGPLAAKAAGAKAGTAGGFEGLKHWLFDTSVSKPVDISASVPGLDSAIAGVGDVFSQVGGGLTKAYTETVAGFQEVGKSLEPFFLEIKTGPQWPVPKVSW